MADDSRRAALRVNVLVDLERRPSSGGHVKVWEKLAAAAVRRAGELDLTVHFSGAAADSPETVEVLADNVRLRAHRPVFSSARLPFLPEVPDHADLAPYHRALARHLGSADVLHTTDAYFAFARTAERLARRDGVPLVTSVHTNTPGYTRLYAAATVERLWGRGWFGRMLLEGCGVARRAEARMSRRLRAHQRLCAFSLLSRPTELEALAAEMPRARLGLLRRGVDHTLYSPATRDRPWLESALGVPAGRVVLLYVGRLDCTKNVVTLAQAVAVLAAEGSSLHLVCIGAGADREAIARAAPGAVTFPGMLPPDTLARVYASADLLAQPSELEECSNVVQEALASGLPVLVPDRGGSGRLVVDGETGVIVRGPGPAPWVEALRALARDGDRRRVLSQAARRWAEQAIPSWADVLGEDLLPRWRAAAAAAVRPPVGPPHVRAAL